MKVTLFVRTIAALFALIIVSSAGLALAGTGAPATAGAATNPAAAAVAAASAAPAARESISSAKWVQASLLLGSGFNAGVGFRPWERISLSLNLDIFEDQGSASASAIMYILGDVPILTRAYVGAGATWELDRRAVHPSLTAGAEFRLLFAEYEWVMAPESYGKIRSGLRISF